MVAPIHADEAERKRQGEEVKAKRLHLGLSQRELAQVLGYSHQNKLSDIERGLKVMNGTARAALDRLVKEVRP